MAALGIRSGAQSLLAACALMLAWHVVPMVTLEALDSAQSVHPSVLGIGVAKCGTSDLFWALHDLFPHKFNMPTVKEINLLAHSGLQREDVMYKQYMAALNVSGPNPFTLDFSPHYFWSDEAAANAKQLMPQGGKTIVMLREPVSMVLSYLNYRKGRADGTGLEDGINLEAMDATEVLLVELDLLQRPRFQELLLSACTSEPTQAFFIFQKLGLLIDKELVSIFGAEYSNNGQGFLMPGLYLPSLRLWADTFFRLALSKNTLVIFSDAYYADKAATLRDVVIPFLFGPEERVDEAQLERTASEVINQMPYTKDIAPTLRCALYNFFKPLNCRLAKFLHDTEEMIEVYPADRVSKYTWGCDLWPDSSTAAECGLEEYTQRVRQRLRHSIPRARGR